MQPIFCKKPNSENFENKEERCFCGPATFEIAYAYIRP